MCCSTFDQLGRTRCGQELEYRDGKYSTGSNESIGLQGEQREYGIGAQILASLNIHSMRIITNHPRKLCCPRGLRLEDRRAGAVRRRRNQALIVVVKKAVAKSVDEYLAAVPEPARSTLEKIRKTIRSVVPGETTEVISYRMPAFKYKKIVMWYAAFSSHSQPVPDRQAIIEEFKDELKGYTISKGTIQFPFRQAAAGCTG